MQITGL